MTKTPKPNLRSRRPPNTFERPLRSPDPVLRFTPHAWAKLLYLRDLGDTEIAGFAVCPADDLLLVEQFVMIKQQATAVSVELDDQAVADYFDDQVEQGRKPQQFARIWAHSHPGNSPSPSDTDEDTFDRVFGVCDWALMVRLM